VTKLPLLFNPKAGAARKDPDALMRRLSAEVRERIEPVPFGAPWDFEPYIHAAQRAEGPLLIWGGDGSLHHAAQVLAAKGCPVPLASVPGGSGNGFARGLATPLDPAKAIPLLLAGRELRIDLPRLDGRAFLNLAGTGFEAAVAHGFEALGSRGVQGYVRTVREKWSSQPLVDLKWEALEAHDTPWDPFPEQVWNLTIANLPTHGGGFWMAPGADPTDGWLQWVTLRKPEWWEFPVHGHALFRNTWSPALRQRGRFRRTILHVSPSQPWHLDGELVETKDRVEITLENRAFRVQVGEGCGFW
jgi:diacylglycerol kinase (ATP)